MRNIEVYCKPSGEEHVLSHFRHHTMRSVEAKIIFLCNLEGIQIIRLLIMFPLRKCLPCRRNHFQKWHSWFTSCFSVNTTPHYDMLRWKIFLNKLFLNNKNILVFSFIVHFQRYTNKYLEILTCPDENILGSYVERTRMHPTFPPLSQD